MRLTRDIFCCTIKTIKPLKILNFKEKKHSIYAQITPKFFQIKLSQKKLTLKNALVWNIFDIKNEHFKQKTV